MAWKPEDGEDYVSTPPSRPWTLEDERRANQCDATHAARARAIEKAEVDMWIKIIGAVILFLIVFGMWRG